LLYLIVMYKKDISVSPVRANAPSRTVEEHHHGEPHLSLT
jgi:hypothetical protein